jgi:hypothetical protein
MRISSLIFAFFVLLSSNMAEAYTESELYYTIDRVWFDSISIYIVYTKKRVTSRYSMSDIHGTVIGEKSEIFLNRLPREVGGNSRIYKLDEIEDATSIIYRDKDFDIASVGDGVRLSGGKKTTAPPKCMESIWFPLHGTRQEVIRVRNRLLYCGMLFDPSGDFALEIPKSVTGVVESDHHDHPSFIFPLLILSAISNDNLLIMRADPIGPVTELRIGVWPLNSNKEMKWVKYALPASPGGYEVLTSQVYSPTSFVLRPVLIDDKSVLLCNEARCERISIHDRYSVLIVDEEQKKVIEILPGYMLKKPEVSVYTSSY